MQSHIRRDKFSKIAGMNARIVLSWVDFWTVTLMWKNGQHEAEHSTWMLLLTGKTVHRWWSELSVAPAGQKITQTLNNNNNNNEITITINQSAVDFLRELGCRISSKFQEERQSAYLFQRLSVTVQRFNAVILHNSFPPSSDPWPPIE